MLEIEELLKPCQIINTESLCSESGTQWSYATSYETTIDVCKLTEFTVTESLPCPPSNPCVCVRLKLLIDWPHPGKAWRAQWMWRGTTWRSWTCCPTTWSSTCCRLPTAPAAWCLRRTRSSSSRPKTRGWVANTGRRQWPIQRKFSTSAEKTNVVLVSSSFRHSQCEFASCSMTSVSNTAGWVEDHCSSEWPTTPPGCFETSSKESLLFWIKYFKNIVNLFKMSRCLCLVFLTVELKITLL